MEIWKPIPDFEGYEVSNFGRVRSYRIRRSGKMATKPKLLTINYGTRRGKKRYAILVLRRNGKSHTKALHVIIAHTFFGPPTGGLFVLHRDDNKTNNRLANLYYGDHTQNMKDRRRNNKVN